MNIYRHMHHHLTVCRVPHIGSYLQGQGHQERTKTHASSLDGVSRPIYRLLPPRSRSQLEVSVVIGCVSCLIGKDRVMFPW